VILLYFLILNKIKLSALRQWWLEECRRTVNMLLSFIVTERCYVTPK